MSDNHLHHCHALAENLATRASDLRPSTVDEQSRTVQAVFATENPVRVYHWDLGRVVDEVLVARGMEPVDHVPMVENHNRFDLSAVIGSGESPRVENGQIVGNLRFGTDLGERADSIWQRVLQRHLRSVSVGYQILEAVDIPPGETREINGQQYTAKDRMLRVSTRWRMYEISMVTVPADSAAAIRANSGAANREDQNNTHGEPTDPPRNHEMDLLSYLQSLGLANDADASATRSFVAELDDTQRARAAELATDAERSAYLQQPQAEPPASDELTGARGGDGAAQADPQRALEDERTRVREIMRMAGDQVASDEVQRAINEGWSVDRAGREFYQSVMRSNQEPVGHGGHVGIHSRSAASEVTVQALQAGLLMRLGLDPGTETHRSMLDTMQGRGMLSRPGCQGEWLVDACRSMRNGNPGDEAARALEVANRRWRRRSLPDIAEECCRMAGIQTHGEDREEIVRRAYTTSQFSAIFTTNFSAVLLAGFLQEEDSTQGWCMEEDLPNFQDHELVQVDPMTKLRRKTRNLPGEQVEGGDRVETYAAERYVGTFVLDEQAMMDDNLRGFSRAPAEMGRSARSLRPDLVYKVLLNNPNLASGTALFATAHGNLAGGAALASATLSAAEAAMAVQTRNGHVLNIRASHLIVPRVLQHDARRLVNSTELRDTTASTEYGTFNPNQGQYAVRSDARLDNGFADPDDPQTTIAGQPGSWFLAAANSPGIMVGYVQGSGRAPRIRSRVIDRPGEYGMEWDANMDIGVAPADYVGLLKRQAAAL